MSNITLYELADAYKKIFDSVMDDEANLDALEDTLQCVEASLEVKADNMAKFVKALESDAAACDAEIKRLTDRKRARLNKVERIKAYMIRVMDAADIQKVQGGLFTVRLQKNPPAMTILDEKAIPAQFLTYIPPQPERWEVDKAKLKRALMDGAEVEGAELTQGVSLRIA